MKRFEVLDTPIKGLLNIKSSRIEDERGYLSRLYCSEEMQNMGFASALAQINFTKTISKGTIRGFHFQNPPYAEYKYVRCIKGEVYDVALDLRSGSRTFLNTHAEILSEENDLSFLIPPGVAHGFQSLTDNIELLYMHTQLYKPEYDDGVNPLDPSIIVDWPEEITSMSEKDSKREFLSNNYKGVKIELSSL